MVIFSIEPKQKIDNVRENIDLRVADTGRARAKTYHNFWSWINKRVARWAIDAESHIRLSHQLTANNFARLK